MVFWIIVTISLKQVKFHVLIISYKCVSVT